ncbi:MAG: DNA internalization-related competence protein ComEC/Rec2 [Gammaproteobacteria bacterium]
MLPLIAAAFVGGVCLFQFQTEIPNAAWAALLLPLPLLPFRRARVAAALLFIFAAGFNYADFRAGLRIAQKVPAALEWRDIVAEGIVRGFPDTEAGRTRFDFDIENIVSPPQKLRLRARLADYHHGKPPAAGIKNGARLRIKIRIRPPRANFNPDGFDYAGWQFARGIRAAGYVRGTIAVLEEGGGWRDSVRRRALAAPFGEFLAALTVGDRSAISDAQWQVLRRTGTAHLMSISGTHITLAAGFAAFACGFLWRRSRRLMRLMPAQKAALAAAAPAALGYAALAGFGVPVQRSALMFFAASAAVVGGGMTSVLPVLGAAAIVVVLADPWAVLAAGFWLSFLLAGAVVYAAVNSGRGFFLWRLLKIQFLVSLFAMPLTLWFFNEASLVSPLANFIAVPLAGIVILPLALLGVLLPLDIIWDLAGFLLSGFWAFLETVSALPFASWQAAPPWPVYIPAILGAAWLLMPRGAPLRWTGFFPIIAMLAWPPSAPAAGSFILTVLDVGQGAAVVVETQTQTLVYDTGRRHGFFIVDDFLRQSGGRRVGMLVVSHEDGDHSGGAERLLRFRRPRMFSSPLPPAHRLAQLAENYAPCTAGLEWEWDGVRFAFLHPPTGHSGLSDNESSCVLKISGAGGTALLAGDIPEDTERDLARRYGGALRADILLAAHHGSRYSSAAEFLRAVSPQSAVFSAGAGNRFGHPSADAIRRATEAGAAIYRTDKDGAVQFKVSRDSIKTVRWRPHETRYWHARE